jgi:LPXTG-motif cell wall-anchored protein
VDAGVLSNGAFKLRGGFWLPGGGPTALTGVFLAAQSGAQVDFWLGVIAILLVITAWFWRRRKRPAG